MSHPRPGWLAIPLAGLLLVGCASPPPVPPPSSEETVALQRDILLIEEKVLRARARRDVLDTQQQLLAQKVPRLRTDARAADLDAASVVLRQMSESLRTSADARRVILRQAAAEAAENRQRALDGWKKAREAAFAAETRLAEVQARLVAEGNAAGWQDVLDRSLLLILTGGGLLVLVGVALGAQVRRLQIRQRWRSGVISTAAVMVVLGGVPGACAALDLVGERDRLQAELEELLQQTARAEKSLTSRRTSEEIQGYWKSLLAVPAGKNAPPLAELHSGWEDEAVQLLQQTLVDARTAELAALRGEELLTQAERDRAQAPLLADRAHQLNRMRLGARLTGAAGLTTLAFLPLFLARRSVKKQLARSTRECPRCGKQAGFERKRPPVQHQGLALPLSQECKACGHEFRSSYLRLPRLCFPTVGIRNSGKTHWLVTAYDLIKNYNFPRCRVALQKAPSLADDEFDAMVQVVLEEHLSPQPTRIHLPAPLTFHARDTDPLGRNATLLNLFDYSGEVMNQRIDMSELRLRSLSMDGFILFLDPTQVYQSGTSVGLEHQIRQVSNFRDEMREARGLAPGAPLRIPVAVCVSKLDLLVNRNPMGGSAVLWLRRLRATAGLPLTLETLEKRSALLADALPVIFPGWNITRALGESFGRHFLFFPMTPVGMEEHELGVEDLNARTIAPFGIVEPIVWLLHMHGYKVLT